MTAGQLVQFIAGVPHWKAFRQTARRNLSRAPSHLFQRRQGSPSQPVTGKSRSRQNYRQS